MKARQKAWILFRGEVKYLFRGRFPLAVILIALPLSFTILFGMVYSKNVVNGIRMAIYDEDQSSMSRQFIQMYNDSERFHIVAYVDSEEDMEQAINSGQVQVAVAIPRDFSKNVKLGSGSNVMLMVNSANNMFANSALTASQEIVRSYAVAVGQKMLESTGLLPQQAMNSTYPVRLGVRILGNSTNGYTPFMLCGLMMNGVQIGIMLTIAPLLVTEILKHRYGWGYASWLHVAVRWVPYWLLAMTGYAFSLFMAVHCFAVPMHGSWFDALVLGGAFCFFVCGVLMLFSVCCPSQVLAFQAPMLYIMPGLLYSGISWPEFDMSQYAVLFGVLLPMTYGGDTLRDIMLMGYAPALKINCGKMLFGGLFCGLLSWGIFVLRRRIAWKKGEIYREGEAVDHGI
jgi:ABC-2 type transport system permease protein